MFDDELYASLTLLYSNIRKRRATAFKNLISKYENCSEDDDEVIDLETFTFIQRSTKSKKWGSATRSDNARGKVPRIETSSKYVSYCITEEDRIHLEVIHQKLREKKNRRAGAKNKTSSPSQVLETKGRTLSEVVGNGLDKDIGGKKQPSNKTELHSIHKPKDKVSLLKPSRRIKPRLVRETRLNLKQDALGMKQPSNEMELHSICTPRDNVSLPKPAQSINLIQFNVKQVNWGKHFKSKDLSIEENSKCNPRSINLINLYKLDESLKHIPIAEECMSPKSTLTPNRRHFPPEKSLNRNVRKLNESLKHISIAPECMSPTCPLTPNGQHFIPERPKTLERNVRRLNKSLQHIPNTVECITPKCPSSSIRPHFVPKQQKTLDHIVRNFDESLEDISKAMENMSTNCLSTPIRQHFAIEQPKALDRNVRRLNKPLQHTVKCMTPKCPSRPIRQHFTPQPNILHHIPIALECTPPSNHLTRIGQSDTTVCLRSSVSKRRNNLSVNAKLNNSPIHNSSVNSTLSYLRKRNLRSKQHLEY